MTPFSIKLENFLSVLTMHLHDNNVKTVISYACVFHVQSTGMCADV